MIDTKKIKMVAPIIKNNMLEIHASLPCPLKVPFKQMFTPFLEKFGAEHPDLQVQCSNITDCSITDTEKAFREATDESELPDILITTNYRILLANGFYNRFVANHIFEGVCNPKYADQMAPIVKDHLLKHNIGVWAFSSWSFVQDLTIEHENPITSWEQMASPELEGKITAHGHLDKATFSIAYFIRENFGEEGLIQYAKNIADVKHFAQAIKRMNSDDPNKTLLTMLPDVAISNIPSKKKTKIVDLKEAKVLSPLVMMVKRSKMALCKDLLDALWSEPFSNLLAEKGALLPYKLDSSRNYFLPDFKELSKGFEQLEEQVDKTYVDNLDMEMILAKATDGGMCK